MTWRCVHRLAPPLRRSSHKTSIGCSWAAKLRSIPRLRLDGRRFDVVGGPRAFIGTGAVHDSIAGAIEFF